MKFTNSKKIISLFCGAAIGIICGLFGGGGGILAIPVLTKLYKMQEKQAHATSLFVMLPLSFIAAVAYFCGNKVQIMPSVYVCTGMSIGGIIGIKVLSKISDSALRMVFSVLMCITGVYSLITAL